MITKLEQVTSARELITYTKSFGVPTSAENICTMQDIIGNSTVDELTELANKEGSALMFLLFHIWNWERATDFYNKYVNQQYKAEKEEIEKLRKENKEQKADISILKDRSEKDRKAIDALQKSWEDTDAELFETKNKLEEAEKEIVKLKAMLFDYMVKAK